MSNMHRDVEMDCVPDRAQAGPTEACSSIATMSSPIWHCPAGPPAHKMHGRTLDQLLNSSTQSPFIGVSISKPFIGVVKRVN
jgi:hypothetical protein